MTILVTGARGRIARAVVWELLGRGVPVRVTSREPAALDLPDRVEAATGRAALAGVSTVFLYAGGVEEWLDAAVVEGVRRVVLLSAAGASDTSTDPIARMHGAAEKAVMDSGIGWTFLRPGGFATNTLQWADSIRAEGVVRAPFPQAQSAVIHEADIAAVAVRALLEPGHDGRIHQLSGPESVTQQRQVELIAEAAGRAVRFVELTPEQYRQTLSRWGAADVVDALLRHLAEADGRPDSVCDTVAEVTGRPARTFAQWAADHAEDFRAPGPA
jgi:uncharacterized protein YbjT (DUF2867 family)